MFGLSVESRQPARRHRLAADRSPRRYDRRSRYAESGVEPSIEELLSDPVTEALMRCDGVSEVGLRSLIAATRSGLRGR